MSEKTIIHKVNEKKLKSFLKNVVEILEHNLPVNAGAYFHKLKNAEFSLITNYLSKDSILSKQKIKLAEIEFSFIEMENEKNAILLPYHLPAKKGEKNSETNILIASPLFLKNKLSGILVLFTQANSITFTHEDQSKVVALSTLFQASLKSILEKEKSSNNVDNKDQLILDRQNSFLEKSNQGFLQFTKDCIVKPPYQKEIAKIFNKPIEKENALDLLFNTGEVSNKDSASFNSNSDLNMVKDLMETVFLRITDLDVIIELLPTEFRINNNIYEINYQYLKAKDISDDTILAIFSNVSKEKSLTAQVNQEIARNKMIANVAMDVNGFVNYQKDIEELLEKMFQELEKPLAEINIKSISDAVKILGSGAEIYEMNDVSILSNRVDGYLEKFLQKNEGIKQEDADLLIQEFAEIKDLSDFLKTKYLSSLIKGVKSGEEMVYKISGDKINSIQKEIQDQVFKNGFEKIESIFEKNYLPFTKVAQLEKLTIQRLSSVKASIWDTILPEFSKETVCLLDKLKKQPLSVIFKKFSAIAESFGKRLNKQIEINLKGEEIEVPINKLENLFNGMILLINNSVEHGIETMEERVFSGKNLEGRLNIEANLNDENDLTIKISDDGKGIDLERIKNSAIKKQYITEQEAEKISEEDLPMLMFNMNYKTEDNGTTYKRGGLDSLSGAIKELNGSLGVFTKVDEGTTVTIEIPLSKI